MKEKAIEWNMPSCAVTHEPPAESREIPWLKTGNSNAFFREKCLTKNKRLHKKNMIVKTENKNDRRAYDISLSNQGEEIIQTLTHLADESNNQALSGLSDKDIETLCKLLNCIIDNLEDK